MHMTTFATRSGAKRGPYAKTARRRAEIVEAATSVFAARGYHGGSLRDIARQIDLSFTSLVHHFPSKSDLLEAVLESADSTADWFGERARQQGLKVAILELVEINFSRTSCCASSQSCRPRLRHRITLRTVGSSPGTTTTRGLWRA